MSSHEFFEKLSRALRAEGVTSRAEKRLSAEYYDHYVCSAEELQKQGIVPSAAVAAAVEALGDPEYLAKAAAEKWRAGLWSNRHPWLFGLTISLGIYLIASALVLLAVEAAFLFKGAERVQPHSFLAVVVVSCATLANWLPTVFGGSWMGWQYRCRRLQSRTFWIGCLGVALGASLFLVNVVPPTPEHSGSITIEIGPLAALLLWPGVHLFQADQQWGYGSWKSLIGTATTVTMWLQILLAFVLAWVVSSSLFRPKSDCV